MMRCACTLVLMWFVVTHSAYAIERRASPGQRGSDRNENQVYVITNVNVLPMVSKGEVIEHASVVIRGTKIESINADIPDTVDVIDGSGKWLLPGLIDMHVHTPTDGHFNAAFPTRNASIFTSTQDVMLPYVVNGITTIFELNAMAGHFGQRNEILRGDVVGPRMALAALINGGNGSGRIARTPDEGRLAVRMVKAEGYEFIKVYSQLDTATYDAILNEAGSQGMKVVGHLPNACNGSILQALRPHMDLVAHAEEYFKLSDGYPNLTPAYLAQVTSENGTWVCPTLITIVSIAEQSRSLDKLHSMPTLRYVHPLLQSKWVTSNNYAKNATRESIARLDRMIDFNKRLVVALRNAGVPIVAGTDAGTSGVVWGYSLHDELELLVDAGLLPEEALISATRLPATWLNIQDKVGTVEVGKLADLILLDADPRADIKNARAISGVFVNGHWLSKEFLHKMLDDLSIRNDAMKTRFDWKDREKY